MPCQNKNQKKKNLRSKKKSRENHLCESRRVVICCCPALFEKGVATKNLVRHAQNFFLKEKSPIYWSSILPRYLIRLNSEKRRIYHNHSWSKLWIPHCHNETEKQTKRKQKIKKRNSTNTICVLFKFLVCLQSGGKKERKQTCTGFEHLSSFVSLNALISL